MGKTIKITINSSKLDKRLNHLQTRFPMISEEAVTKGAFMVERKAKQKVPVDTGRLKGSIHTVIESDSTSSTAMVGTDVEYAGFVENGTSKQRPQPYLRPALQETEDDIVNYVKASVRNALKGR